MREVITLADCRESKCFCIEGGKTFFEKHGLCWRDFIKNGVCAKKIKSINDAMANRILECARERWQQQDSDSRI